ncbi:hypothetical protein [Ramlibacter sp. AN1133]|uniref:hypothetical protein n=1 Tax=Ramlibacter sp. AN1133 TaxID=3133429 RepID=UPI0030BAA712
MTAPPASAEAPGQAEHPAPHRHVVSPFLVWACLLAPPTAWFVQLAVEEVISSRACFPQDVPLAAARLAVTPLLAACDATAMAIAAVAALVAWRNWRQTAREKPGGGKGLMESGDGRTRFMSMAGVLTSGLILLAASYALASHLALSGCGT